MQKIQILTFLRAPSIWNQWVCLWFLAHFIIDNWFAWHRSTSKYLWYAQPKNEKKKKRNCFGKLHANSKNSNWRFESFWKGLFYTLSRVFFKNPVHLVQNYMLHSLYPPPPGQILNIEVLLRFMVKMTTLHLVNFSVVSILSI